MSRGASDEDRGSDEDAATAGAENALHSQGDGRGGPGPLQIVLRLLAPAAAALALVSVIVDDTTLDHDLVLIAPPRAEPGSAIPLRALLYAGLAKPQGPALVHGKTAVALRDASGRTLAQTTLRAGYGPSLEGELSVPGDARGQLTLRALTQAGDERVEVERKLVIGAPEPAVLAPRALGALQQLAIGALVHKSADELPDATEVADPSALTLRVAGGACAPELPCELIVHVGDPADVLRVASTPSVTVARAPEAGVTNGFALLRVQTHGPEGNLELRKSTTSRAVRLPIAMGADAMELPHVVLEPSAIPSAALLGDNARGIADLFQGDRWLSSTTMHGSALLGRALAPGLYRAQLRRDPFESESAAVRSFYVRAPGETDRDVLRALAAQVTLRERTREPDARDALAAQLARKDGDAAATAAAAGFDGASRYLLAALDEGIYRLPTAASGYPIARKRALEHREDVRKLALVILVLAAASLVLMVVQRGLIASEQAASVLRASGTAHAGVRREQLRMTLRVVGSALAVVLVFCAIALYLIIRGRAL